MSDSEAFDAGTADFDEAPVTHPGEALMRRFADRLEVLQRFDAPRANFIGRLIQRSLEEPLAGERLRSRATSRLDELERDYEERRHQAKAELARLEQTGWDPHGQWRESFEAGALRAVIRFGRRRPGWKPALRFRLAQEQTNRLTKRLAKRGEAPASSPPPATPQRGRSGALALAERLYEERSGDALAQRALERLESTLPEQSGPYHPASVAASALRKVEELHRPLLRAWLQRLANLAAVGAPEEPKKKK